MPQENEEHGTDSDGKGQKSEVVERERYLRPDREGVVDASDLLLSLLFVVGEG